MSTIVTQKIYGDNNKAAAAEATEKIRSLERMLNFFQPESEVSRINNSAGREKVQSKSGNIFSFIQINRILAFIRRRVQYNGRPAC